MIKNIIIAFALLVSTLSGQCDDITGTLSATTSGFNATAGYTHNYVLVDANTGTILAINTSGTFSGLTDGDYYIYAVNYADPAPAQLSVGNLFNDVNTFANTVGNCMDIEGPYLNDAITVCIPDTICETQSYNIGTTGEYTLSAYQQIFVLVDGSGNILAANSTGDFTQTEYISDGSFVIYAINTEDPTLISEIMDLGAWSDVSTLANTSCSDILGPKNLIIIDELLSPCSIILPASDILLKGSMENQGNFLTWTTSSEKNTLYHHVLTSANGNDFYSIGTVNAIGNSTNEQQYQFMDPNAMMRNYYRIEVEDEDGTTMYSNTIVLNRDHGNEDMTIYPNPGKDHFKIGLSGFEGKVIQIWVINALGQKIRHMISTVDLNTYYLDLDLSNEASGAYQIILQSEDINLSRRLMKLR